MAAIPRTFEEAFPGTPEPDPEEDEQEDDNENPVAAIAVGLEDGNINNNNVTLQTVRDNIISPKTRQAYVSDLLQLLPWVYTNENQWLTEYGNEQLGIAFVRQENETARQHRARKVNEVTNLLRDAYTRPIVHLHRIIPSKYLSFILTLHRNNAFLSKSSYGSKRAALFHLFRLHNRIGFNEEFRAELTNLFRGLYRQVATQRNIAFNNDENNQNNREGREIMSVELFKFLCETFLKYGTADGIFGHCYLVLSWNLACRCNNTARIKFSDIRWSQAFDAFSILFSQSKTDQLGEEAKYPRHLYANPVSPLVCPVLAVAMYLTSCFDNNETPANLLFPGESQDARFANLLQRTIDEKWEQISQMGYKRGEIGTHSIRKGAVSYMSSLPGGPPVASICNRAGWTMGKVKDIYMRYVTSGDQFVGRCLCLSPILSTEFASSPPYFEDDQLEWVDALRRRQFKMVALINGMTKLTRMCLASILYHYEWLVNVLGRNHTFLVSSVVHRNEVVENYRESVKVTFPWNDSNHHYSGIPPHVAVLQDLSVLKNAQQQLLHDQQQMVGNFVAQTRRLLEEMGHDGGRMADRQYMRNMLDEFQHNFDQRFDRIMQLVPNQQLHQQANAPAAIDRVEDGTVYTLHFYSGSYKRVPIDWRFPRCSVFEMWRQWWIGDTVRNVPPLRYLQLADVKHIDDMELSVDELHGRKGRFRLQRRKSTKVLSDMKYLMEFIKRTLTARNAYRAETTIETVDEMYRSVSDLFHANPRTGQLNWLTAVNTLRRTERVAVGGIPG
jgi:hypothetical protein